MRRCRVTNNWSYGLALELRGAPEALTNFLLGTYVVPQLFRTCRAVVITEVVAKSKDNGASYRASQCKRQTVNSMPAFVFRLALNETSYLSSAGLWAFRSSETSSTSRRA